LVCWRFFYLEAAIGGLIVGCLNLPNGNPAPGPSYKLRWFERLTNYAQSLLDSGAPAVLAGDFNVMPTELDVYRMWCEVLFDCR
jgi:exodeoxyribonuclease-3